MAKEIILKVQDFSLRLNGKQVLKNISFSMSEGEFLVITGATGSGKSMLLRALSDHRSGNQKIVFSEKCKMPAKVIYIPQQHHFTNKSNISSFYYQQRFNATESDDAQTVAEYLGEIENSAFAVKETLELVGIAERFESNLLHLSNGENKRLQLAKALLQKPDWLLLDNPHLGLDTAARKMLDEVLKNLCDKGLSLIIASTTEEIPLTATHVAILEDGAFGNLLSAETFFQTSAVTNSRSMLSTLNWKNYANSLSEQKDYAFVNAVKMINVSIKYNNRNILDNINWSVKKGECWSVSGPNGSGKSTLLSLITGDNPQAFAKEIYIFDKRKGSGETIWEIKRKIGFVSPELHLHFNRSSTGFDVVASGLFDTIGLFKRVTAMERDLVEQFLTAFKLERFSKALFTTMSSGVQRIVLLARALIKNPPLLILDEPCQGMEESDSNAFLKMIDEICGHGNKTLIYVSHYKNKIPSCVTHNINLEKKQSVA